MGIYMPILHCTSERMDIKITILLGLILLFGVTCRRRDHHLNKMVHPIRKIVGGQFANPGEFQFQVSIRYGIAHRCSGSIIALDAVITLASCLERTNLKDLLILAGTTNLRTGGHGFRIKEIIKVPNFNSDGRNLAIVRTTKNIIGNFKEITGIAINFDEIPDNAMVNISGWGQSSALSQQAIKLKYTTVRTLTHDDCEHKADGYAKVTETNICTMSLDNESDAGICAKDGGGPVVFNGELIAVIAYSNMCKGKSPDVHILLRPFQKWINDILFNKY